MASDTFSKHVRGCKKSPFDCPTCVAVMEGYKQIPLTALSERLEDVMPTPFTTTIAAQAVDKLIDRTTHESQQAKRDVALVMPLLKAYEQRGGHL